MANENLKLSVVVIIINAISLGHAINCYTCDVTDCYPGIETACTGSQVCMNEVREENSLFTVRKQCREPDSCATLMDGNPAQCHRNNSEVNSLCHYCCDTNLCNSGDYPDSTTVAPVSQAVIDSTSSGSAADSDSKWTTTSSHFILMEKHYTVRDDSLVATIPSSNTAIVCSYNCLRRSACGFFAFDEVTKQCFLGGGVYEFSKLAPYDEGMVYEKLTR